MTQKQAIRKLKRDHGKGIERLLRRAYQEGFEGGLARAHGSGRRGRTIRADATIDGLLRLIERHFGLDRYNFEVARCPRGFEEAGTVPRSAIQISTRGLRLTPPADVSPLPAPETTPMRSTPATILTCAALSLESLVAPIEARAEDRSAYQTPPPVVAGILTAPRVPRGAPSVSPTGRA